MCRVGVSPCLSPHGGGIRANCVGNIRNPCEQIFGQGTDTLRRSSSVMLRLEMRTSLIVPAAILDDLHSS